MKESNEHGRWEEMDDLAARQKISHWFRHLRFKDSLPRRVSTNSGSSERTPIPESWDDVVAECKVAIFNDHGSPTKRLTPALKLDDDVLIDDDSRFRDITFLGYSRGAPEGTCSD